MSYDVLLLQRAEADVRHIAQWIFQRSPQGARAWLDAVDQLIDQLAERAGSCPVAVEETDCHIPLRQALFRTRHGRTYRAIFTIVGQEVRILRIRGPGQPPLANDELS